MAVNVYMVSGATFTLYLSLDEAERAYGKALRKRVPLDLKHPVTGRRALVNPQQVLYMEASDE